MSCISHPEWHKGDDDLLLICLTAVFNLCNIFICLFGKHCHCRLPGCGSITGGSSCLLVQDLTVKREKCAPQSRLSNKFYLSSDLKEKRAPEVLMIVLLYGL